MLIQTYKQLDLIMSSKSTLVFSFEGKGKKYNVSYYKENGKYFNSINLKKTFKLKEELKKFLKQELYNLGFKDLSSSGHLNGKSKKIFTSKEQDEFKCESQEDLFEDVNQISLSQDKENEVSKKIPSTQEQIDDIKYNNLSEISLKHDINRAFNSGINIVFRNHEIETLSKETEEYGKKIKLKILELTKNDFSFKKQVKLEAIFSDIYGTTTMEHPGKKEGEVKESLLKDKKDREEFDFEAKLINDAFFNLKPEDLLPLSKESIFEIHKKLTVGLDENFAEEDKNLYNPGSIRVNQPIDLGIFDERTPNQKQYYLPPESPEDLTEKVIKYINFEGFSLKKLALFHLMFYGIHPFNNGNKRTLRLIESFYIQQNIDKGHYLLGMGYYFKKNINKYFQIIKECYELKSSPEVFIEFYLTSFKKMCDISLEKAKLLKSLTLEDYLIKNKINTQKYLTSQNKDFFEELKIKAALGNFKIKAPEIKRFLTKEGLVSTNTMLRNEETLGLLKIFQEIKIIKPFSWVKLSDKNNFIEINNIFELTEGDY